MDCRQTGSSPERAERRERNSLSHCRGKQAESRSAAWRKAVHHAFKRLVWVAVDCDTDALAGPDMFDLGFLEIRHDPHIVDRNDIEQGGARRHQPADANLAIADDAVDRRTYHCAVEVDLSEIRAARACATAATAASRWASRTAIRCCCASTCCRCRRHARLGPRARGIAFIDLGLADGAGADKFAAAVGAFVARFISAMAERFWASACRMSAC